MPGVFIGEPECVTRALVARESSEYFNGSAQPPTGDIPDVGTKDYLLERASISSVLIANTADMIIDANDTPLGYGFKHEPTNKIKTVGGLQEWVQAECHTALDQLIESDDNMELLANRYQDLALPQFGLGQQSNPRTRRQTLLFHQAVSEPYAWVRIAAISANYRRMRMLSSQVSPFLEDKLKVMQQSAQQDIALERVRGAVFEAADAFGTMLSGGNEKDTAFRYAALSSYVLEKAGHALAGRTFGDLHDVEIDRTGGFVLTERPVGFGAIVPARDEHIACPASYRFVADPSAAQSEKSALFRLLRASVNAMHSRGLFSELVAIRQTATPVAIRELSSKLS